MRSTCIVLHSLRELQQLFCHADTSSRLDTPHARPHADFSHLVCYELTDDDSRIITVVFRERREDGFAESEGGDVDGAQQSAAPVEKWEVHCSTVSQASLLAVRTDASPLGRGARHFFANVHSRNSRVMPAKSHSCLRSNRMSFIAVSRPLRDEGPPRRGGAKHTVVPTTAARHFAGSAKSCVTSQARTHESVLRFWPQVGVDAPAKLKPIVGTEVIRAAGALRRQRPSAFPRRSSTPFHPCQLTAHALLPWQRSG